MDTLYSGCKEIQKTYLASMNPLSGVSLDEMNARRDDTEHALALLEDHKRGIIQIAIEQFTKLVNQAEDIDLTDALHHAINNNTTITIAQLGVHSNHNIKALKRNDVPVTEKSTYDAHFSGIGRTISANKHIISMPNDPVWKLFGNTQDEAEEKYGFVMFNETNRNFYFHPREEGQEDKYKTIQEYHDYIKQKGFSERTVKLGQPNDLITEAIKSGEASLKITDQNVIRVYSKVERYAMEVSTIEYMLKNQENKEPQAFFLHQDVSPPPDHEPPLTDHELEFPPPS